MDNGKDGAEYASRLNTCSWSSKRLMSLENVSLCSVECYSVKGTAGIQESVAEYVSVEVFYSLCACLKSTKNGAHARRCVCWGEISLLLSWVLLLESHNWHSKQLKILLQSRELVVFCSRSWRQVSKGMGSYLTELTGVVACSITFPYCVACAICIQHVFRILCLATLLRLERCARLLTCTSSVKAFGFRGSG